MYNLTPAEPEESKLFFRMDGEAAERHGAICNMMIVFVTDSAFITLRAIYQNHLYTPAFLADRDRVFAYLRSGTDNPPFENHDSYKALCRAYKDKTLTGGGIHAPYAFGVKVHTDDYSYYVRYLRSVGIASLFAYDNRYLLFELAGLSNPLLDGYGEGIDNDV
jgi:hypothetical protein